ncbi:hypothetical protein HDV63DRAFT_388528 [Trichoderma sp. SZMC 28014]
MCGSWGGGPAAAVQRPSFPPFLGTDSGDRLYGQQSGNALESSEHSIPSMAARRNKRRMIQEVSANPQNHTSHSMTPTLPFKMKEIDPHVLLYLSHDHPPFGSSL